jgi:hypothetical protein
MLLVMMHQRIFITILIIREYDLHYLAKQNQMIMSVIIIVNDSLRSLYILMSHFSFMMLHLMLIYY